MQRRREKQAQRLERRAAKKERAEDMVAVDNPMDDPTIDWGDAVREVKVDPVEVGLAEAQVEDSP